MYNNHWITVIQTEVSPTGIILIFWVFFPDIMSHNRHCQSINYGFLGIQSTIKNKTGFPNLSTIDS